MEESQSWKLDLDLSVVCKLPGATTLVDVYASCLNGEAGLGVCLLDQAGRPSRRWAKWCCDSSAVLAELLVVEFGMKIVIEAG